MITKGIIEEIIDSSKARVRIPFINGYKGLSNSVPSDSLDEAQISTAFGVYPNLNVGDEVYVAFENGYADKPVIIGTAVSSDSKPELSKRFGDAAFDNLTVTGNVTLPANTMLGTVPLSDLMGTVGQGGSLTESVDTINVKLTDIYEIISKVPEFEVKGYTGFYDGNDHGPTVDVKSDATTLLYSEDNETFSSVIPTYKFGNHTVYVKASTLAESVVKEAEINISQYPISFHLKKSVFSFGEKINPELIFNTVNSADDVSAGATIYIDESGQEFTQITDPGTYKIKVLFLGGKDAEKYILPENPTATLVVAEVTDYTYEWGGVTNTMYTYDGRPHSFTIYKSIRGTNQ